MFHVTCTYGNKNDFDTVSVTSSSSSTSYFLELCWIKMLALIMQINKCFVIMQKNRFLLSLIRWLIQNKYSSVISFSTSLATHPHLFNWPLWTNEEVTQLTVTMLQHITFFWNHQHHIIGLIKRRSIRLSTKIYLMSMRIC